MKSGRPSLKTDERKSMLLPLYLKNRPHHYTRRNFPKDDVPETKKELPSTSKVAPNLRNSTTIETDPGLRELEIDKLRREREDYDEETKFQDTEIRKSQKESWICWFIDGHDITKKMFELIWKEFQPLKQSVFICPYVYNKTEESKYNWRFQRQNVVNHYKTNLLTTLSDEKGKLIIAPYNTQYSSEIEQVYKIALDNMCNYFIVTTNGWKGPLFKPQKLKKGIDFLLGTSILPTIIVKDSEPRGHFGNCKGYKWWIVVDRGYWNNLRALDYFLPWINKKKDIIFCLTLLPKFIQFDDVKEKFDAKMKEIGMDKENTQYEAQPYQSNYMKEVLLEFVNHNPQDYFDYVVFYNNPEAYRMKGVETESFQMVDKWIPNMCFVNGDYLDPMFLGEKH